MCCPDVMNSSLEVVTVFTKLYKFDYNVPEVIKLVLDMVFMHPLMRSWVQVLETTSCRNAEKGYVHKTQSDRTLPRTLHKRELRTPGCLFLWFSCTQSGRTLPQSLRKRELCAPGFLLWFSCTHSPTQKRTGCI
jgi:hypothetical protein